MQNVVERPLTARFGRGLFGRGFGYPYLEEPIEEVVQLRLVALTIEVLFDGRQLLPHSRVPARIVPLRR